MSVYERWGMRGCIVVEWVKRDTLRWFVHIERMDNEEFVRRCIGVVLRLPTGGEGHLEDGMIG